MISITSLLSRGIQYIRKHPQLLMTLLLVIVIPIAFLISGQQFLSAARVNQERLEMDRIGMLHDVFISFVHVSEYEPAVIQKELESLLEKNRDIAHFQVVKEKAPDVAIIASSNQEEIGSTTSPKMYRLSNATGGETIIFPSVTDGVRYWESVSVLMSKNNETYYVYTKTSLEHIDSLFASRIRAAYYWLIGLLFIILLLLFRHIRLIDYAYLYRETKHANEIKDLFTNMIAHELRAPLTAMRGYASMIRERNESKESVKDASEIEAASGRLVTIVSDLLNVARIQSGKLKMENESVHISGVLRSVVEALYPSAQEKGVTLTVEDTVGNLRGMGDEKRFHQALTNVVSNAIKYTKEGAVTVSATPLSDRIEVRVKDTGMGISSENQKRLFAPFTRIEENDAPSITGTGLGMWITKQLVELMGGSIGLESIKGVGTHVVITLKKAP
jgi:signal transduction histidine kinase